MLWLFLTSGTRKRELTNIQLDHLHWDQNNLWVMGKGQKEREAPFVIQAQLAVMKYLQHRQDDLPWLWVTASRGPRVVQRLSYDGIGEDMDRLRERAGLKGQLKDVCHIYRRTLTRDEVEQGVPRPYIKSKMGWDTEAMIEHYTAGMELESEANEAFNRLKPFGGGSPLK